MGLQALDMLWSIGHIAVIVAGFLFVLQRMSLKMRKAN